MIIIPKNIDVSVDVNKIARISQKIFDLLTRRTKKPYEAYVALLILKMFFEEQMGFNEDEFEPIVDVFKRHDKD